MLTWINSLTDHHWQTGQTELLAEVFPALERVLAPIFIRAETYGTRASTLAYAREDGSLAMIERRFGPKGAVQGEARVDTRSR